MDAEAYANANTNANTNANADAGGSTIALCERCSGKLKSINIRVMVLVLCMSSNVG